MGAEQRKPTTFDLAKNKTLYLGVRATTPIIQIGQEKISRSSTLEFKKGFWEQYGEMRSEGYVPIDVSNHTAQQDADSLAKVTDTQFKFEESLNPPNSSRLIGFRLPLAQILNTGGHGPIIQAIYHADYALLEKHHLKPLLLARAKDVKAGDAKPNLIEYYKQMMQAFGEGHGIAGFLEGDTWGRKRDENGNLNGMHALEADSIRSIVSAAKRANRKTMIVPIGIEGGYRIQNPMTKMPTRWALRIGFGFSNRNLVRIKVGLPIPTDQGELGELLNSRQWINANTLIEKEIASLLPHNLRGIHK